GRAVFIEPPKISQGLEAAEAGEIVPLLLVLRLRRIFCEVEQHARMRALDPPLGGPCQLTLRVCGRRGGAGAESPLEDPDDHVRVVVASNLLDQTDGRLAVEKSSVILLKALRILDAHF